MSNGQVGCVLWLWTTIVATTNTTNTMMSAIRVTIFFVTPILTHLHRSILLVDSLFQFNSPLSWEGRWFVACDGWWCIYGICYLVLCRFHRGIYRSL